MIDTTYSSENLDSVFGADSKGTDPQDRAATSDRKFVRGQVQIAFDNERATGRRLLASEALRLFGWEKLLEVSREGSATIIGSIKEPATTIKKRRLALNIAHKQLSIHAGVSINAIETAEQEGSLSKFRDLEKLCQFLSIDERVLGLVDGGKTDKDLAVRLRRLSDAKEEAHFSPKSVLILSEAAWVIDRQADMQEDFDRFSNSKERLSFTKDFNYSYPAWKQGYRLAAITREKLGLSEYEAIPRLRHLIESKLDIPLIQQKLNASFAGATLANGKARGIVINEEGANSNVWTRRMTLCHELGHLLWDPDQKLDKLKVDTYTNIDRFEFKKIKDVVEERANAFAVAFLAPPAAVKAVVKTKQDATEAVATLMHSFGVSFSAARHHISNITKMDTTKVEGWRIYPASDDWIGRENFTLDWFPAKETPLSRRGKFALLVALSYQRRKISDDTASVLLNIPIESVCEKCGVILDTYRED